MGDWYDESSPPLSDDEDDSATATTSLRNTIIEGGFSTQSDVVEVWGGKNENEFVANERVNDYMQSRICRMERYNNMLSSRTITDTQYRDFIKKEWGGWDGFNPFEPVNTANILTYIISNSSFKDIIWKHLFELINCVGGLEKKSRSILQHCNAFSTTTLDISGVRLDELIASPSKMRKFINSIIVYINCTRVCDEGGSPKKQIPLVKKFKLTRPRVATIKVPELKTATQLQKYASVLMDEEIKLSKWLRELERYHTKIITNTNPCFVTD